MKRVLRTLKAVKTAKPKRPALPAGILESDLVPRKTRNSWKSRAYDYDFELWFTERFGWCIPTLGIRNVPRRMLARGMAVQPRTYAVTLDGQVVTIGLGPHVLFRVCITAYKNRVAGLQKFIDIRQAGMGKAGEIRDSLSTRRMRRAANNWW